ncbi:nitrilase-related carbon-nitrogen hydrolase [Peribacillus sp. NJ11]|uniref:nitrilase-related carbon-nitrogen hydrolase n=1 Tax=Peribacillus sp. NJ11 TaxID=3055861 RepID=UPI0025A31061|nr:nitrilase-related carbon-nitrogen hydrolase [Peribacillus sp. NJ11]MDM5222391.1 nitrilase-related carbon-nitrogen hydrolase [Peribacillus sp. NJ11]
MVRYTRCYSSQRAENQMFVAMANQVGRVGETIFVGGSVIVDPYGRIIAEAGCGEEIISLSIDLSLVQERGKNTIKITSCTN